MFYYFDIPIIRRKTYTVCDIDDVDLHDSHIRFNDIDDVDVNAMFRDILSHPQLMNGASGRFYKWRQTSGEKTSGNQESKSTGSQESKSRGDLKENKHI